MGLSLSARAVAVFGLALLAGCGQGPVTVRPVAARLAPGASQALGTPSSVKALKKAIRDQVEEHTSDHTSVVTDLEVLPSVIWHIFNFDGTLAVTDFASGVTTNFAIAGTYDALTYKVTVTDISPSTEPSDDPDAP